ncbi:S-adenosyl-L-methionine-dependent methyltransferase [Podospora australis]|uniref:S-adenosyl-L-methionine-dependent methyltransferase n=1 Tax=Podospora australis TaxID=1536484 RepID=A0AAN6WTT4_9PEZI|nr:S-adenosyl-L-methionine-dependent methyltransferase [Podospora australis]
MSDNLPPSVQSSPPSAPPSQSPPDDSPLTILTTLLFPLKFILLSTSFLPRTLFSSPFVFPIPFTSSYDSFQSKWFGNFWSHVGPLVRINASALVVPLLSGRISHGATLPYPRHPPLQGTVLEVGPGSGMWTSTLSSLSQNITKIYGVEPNESNQHLLAQSVKAANLQDKYEIVPLGIESLAAAGKVQKESVDCIMTVMCLCSIPEPQFNIKELYTYLKPGGRWYVYEHVKAFERQGKWMGLYQTVLNFFWPHFVGGCEMCRDTPKWLREAGPWSEIDLCEPVGSPWYQTMPHIIGVLTK